MRVCYLHSQTDTEAPCGTTVSFQGALWDSFISYIPWETQKHLSTAMCTSSFSLFSTLDHCVPSVDALWMTRKTFSCDQILELCERQWGMRNELAVVSESKI